MFFNRKQRFSIRKFTIGTCSVLLGTVLIAGVNQVSAEETSLNEVVSSSVEKEDKVGETVASATVSPVASVEAPVAAETTETVVARTFVVKNKVAVLDAANLSDSEKAAVVATVRSDNNLTEAFKVLVANDGSVTILENDQEVARLASAEVVEVHATTTPAAPVAEPTVAPVAEQPAPALTVSAETTTAPATETVDLAALKEAKIAELSTYALLSEAVRADYRARFQEAVDAAALELVAKEAKRAQRRAAAFPNEGQAIPTGTGFRADVPAANETLDTEGWKTLGRFSNKPGVFYVQKSGTVNGGNSTNKETMIYEIDTTTGEIVEVSKDDFEGGGTLYEHLEKLSAEQGFSPSNPIPGTTSTRDGYRVVNALGLSNDGRYAYALGITSQILVDDRTTINGIYRYDMESKKWSLVSNSNDWPEGMAVMRTNAWTAGAVNPKDGKYYFGTLTLKTDPAFSQVAPRDDAAYQAMRDNGTFDLYFRMWSFDPATGNVASAGYIDTNLVKSGSFDKNEDYFKRAGESYVVGNDIAFDTDGNMKLIMNQFNSSNYYIYSVDKANFDAAAGQNNKYAKHNGTLSKNIPIYTDINHNISSAGSGNEAVAEAMKANNVTTGGLAIDANGDLFFHSRQGKIGRIVSALTHGGILNNVEGPTGTTTWGDAASIRGTVGKGNVYREYYIQGTENILAGTVGSIVDGKFVPTTETTTGKDDIEKEQALYKNYDATVGRPQAIRAADGTVYEYVQVKENSDPETGEVKKEDQTIRYEYAPKAVTGNVIVKYIDVEGNIIKTEVKDETNADANTPYNTDEDRKLDLIKGTKEFNNEGKIYELVPAGTYGTYNNNPIEVDDNGHLTSSDSTTGDVEAGKTKEVVYVYREVTQPKTGDVVLHYVDTKGNELQPNHHNSDDKPVDESYTVKSAEKPDTLEKDGVVYKKVEVSETGVVDGKPIATENVTTDETGKIIEGTKNIVYVYKPVGSVVIHYVNTKGEVIKQEVKDITDGDIDAPYNAADNKENADEKPATIANGDVNYKFKEVSTSNTVGGKVVVSENDTNVVNGQEGKIVPGTTHVIYVYDEVETPVEKGSVVVNYIDTEGNPLATQQDVVKDQPVGSKYDSTTEALKPAEIKVGDKTYVLAPADSYEGTYNGNKIVVDNNNHLVGSDAITGDVAKETKTITYVYKLKEEPKEEPVKPGSVIVNYRDVDGNYLQPEDTVYDTKDGADKSGYNTIEDLRPKTIAKDGKVYELVEEAGTHKVGKVEANGHLEGTDDVTGTVEAGKTKKVTYIYKEVTPEPKAGNVTVKYVDTEGNPLLPEAVDELNAAIAKEYTTTDHKPKTITTADGTYELAPADDYIVGKVGEDNTLTESKKADLKKSDAETGTVEEGTKTIVYVYKKVETPVEPKGSVVVHYVNEAGEVIQSAYKDTTDAAVDSTYNTKENPLEKPQEITFGGKTYVFKEVSMTSKVGQNDVVKEDAANRVFFSGNETGKVVEGTTHVIYVYSEKQPEENPVKPGGEVTAQYFVEGEETRLYEDPTVEKDTVVKEKDTPVGTEYKDTPPAVLTDGKDIYDLVKKEDGTPKLKEDSANPTGSVTETPQVIKYEYKKRETPKEEPVKPGGEVTAQYFVEGEETRLYKDPTVKEDTVVKEKDTPVGTEYKDTPPAVLTDGKDIYDLVKKEDGTPKLKEGSAEPTGEVTETPQVIKYEYKKRETPKEDPKPEAPKGSVIVKYEDEDGNEIQKPKEDTPLSPVDTPYNTVDKRDEKIEVPNPNDPENPTVYHLTKNEPKEGEGEDDGKVKEGEKVVTYVYKKAGSVIVHYVDEAGNELADDQVAKKNEKDGTAYDTTTKTLRPATITVGDKVYERVPAGTYGAGEVDEDGHLTSTDKVDGSVEAGKTKKITYVYREVKPTTPPTEEKPNKYIPYIPENPEDPSNPKDPKYPNDPENNPPLDPNGNPIPPVDYDNTPEDPSNNPPLPDIDGYVPVDPKDPSEPLKPKDPNDPSKGYEPPKPVDPKKDTPVPYVPAGSVVIHYVDEEGNVIKDKLVDTVKAPVDSEYDATEKVGKREEKPQEITVTDANGKERVYELVRVSTSNKVGDQEVVPAGSIVGAETGKVKKGETNVIYVYKEKPGKYIPFIPVDPNNPNDPTDPQDPTVPETGKPIPPRPYDETPEDPSDDPRLPDVPGYIPVDPSDPSGKTPLKPVDPEDPSKGYEPPKPTDPHEDTPIPYVPAGTVTVHYVNEKGEVIKDPTVDTPKSPVGTKYDTDEKGKEIPREITGKDGEKYVLVKVKDGDKPTGEVEKGNIDVTYIYKLKEKQTPPPVEEEKPNKYIPYIPENPEDPSNPKDPKYPNNPEKNPPLDPNGNPIPPVDYDNTPEDPSNNPPLPDIDGYVPVDPKDPSKPLKPKDPNDPTKGYEPPKPVDPKKDTPVPYVPAGTVTVHYVNEKGEVIKDPTVDTPKSPVGTEYNTNENGTEIPKEITDKDGNVYELVKVKDGDSETGKVVKGNTDVTYIYKLKEKPGVPAPGTPSEPSNPAQPATPTPVKPANTTTAKLPSTGDTAGNATFAYGAVALGFAALLGLGKKKSEDEE
ncbi:MULTISPECIES: MucBP domain-containing protein [Streptococcus]|nr:MULTISPECIES: MucBP domain-containing protein [unclassified Streptococcus]QTH47144.1 MucBP domain-containing protein [Streptococcus sp. zg-86]